MDQVAAARQPSPAVITTATSTFWFTHLRGYFDANSNQAVTSAFGRLTLYDNKSSALLSIVTAVLGAVVAMLVTLRADFLVAKPAAAVPVADIVVFVLIVVQTLLTLIPLGLHALINNVRRYRAPLGLLETARDEIVTSRSLSLDSALVAHYLAFLADSVDRRSAMLEWLRITYPACLLCGGLAVIAMLSKVLHLVPG